VSTVVIRSHGELGLRECRELLAQGEIGRVAVCTPHGPEILPVGYVVDGVSLVFRTAPYGVLGRHAWRDRIAVEVDAYDVATRSGWSVVAKGHGELVDDPEELALLRAFRDPQAWAPGSRLLYVRLVWDSLTGRTVRAGS
jgi:nitroimidazol reductase NimA-like FMN-containing flavoprotein (pyridoxamine 5'-phosphate oxidase superfamily)